ncbi:SLC5 family protein [Sphingomonas sp. SUN019]|uniref:SLC5 family protein n=1 Tax=Sphingomonas sp. SUN019 TaxID=2937788 RepID=UPI002164B163|nr:SLC5 family protein [Sphingomonas sp. SUN019]UVO49534.1 SLC5 family protein [Sphingomonas sp. SUN019]
MALGNLQIWICIILSLGVAFATYLKVKSTGGRGGNSSREYFLANKGLSWFFVAGSITITNLSTEQLVGMNGNQMALLAWWELSAVAGLAMLAFIFLPIYYRYNCTTVTELLEKRYNNVHVRAAIGGLFLFGNIVIYQPIMLYTSALLIKTMFGLDTPIIVLAALFGIAGAAYAVLGGLRAVAIVDTYSGVLLLGMGTLVVYLALGAINYDFSGIPAERLTMLGGADSPIPWPTLLTGMIFIQMFYWSTNQTITQKAMGSPSLKEAQKGLVAAIVLRVLIIPPMAVIPGIVSYKLFGDIGDQAYGRIVAAVLPNWLSGLFAAAIVSAVLAHFASILNSSATLYVCDLHETYIAKKPDVRRLSRWISAAFVVVAILLVPVYSGADSIINLVQQLNGLTSMPVLSVFAVGLLFRGVDARAAIAGMLFGIALYAFFTFGWTPIHYIHLMAITLFASIGVALSLNRFAFGRTAIPIWSRRPGEPADPIVAG